MRQSEALSKDTPKEVQFPPMDLKAKSTVPKVRFTGFTDDWEQRKLGEVTSSYSGGTPSTICWKSRLL